MRFPYRTCLKLFLFEVSTKIKTSIEYLVEVFFTKPQFRRDNTVDCIIAFKKVTYFIIAAEFLEKAAVLV